MKDDRAKKIAEALRLVWGSLDSHLDFTFEKHHDSKLFHKKTVKEYAKLIKLLTELY